MICAEEVFESLAALPECAGRRSGRVPCLRGLHSVADVAAVVGVFIAAHPQDARAHPRAVRGADGNINVVPDGQNIPRVVYGTLLESI